MKKKILFHNYNADLKPVEKEVNVIVEGSGRLDVIIVEHNNHYQDFYKNTATNTYKFLTTDGDINQRSWDFEEVGLKFPYLKSLKSSTDYFMKNVIPECYGF